MILIDSFKKSAQEIRKTQTLSTVALLIALNLVLDRFTIIVSSSLHISFKFITNALIGMLFGPVAGIYSGVAIDILGYIVYPKGEFFPGFMVSAMVLGVIYGSFLYKNKVSLVRMIGCCTTVTLIVNLGLNTLWLSILYKSPYIPLLISRMPKNLVLLPIEILLLYSASKLLVTAFKKRKITI